VDRTGSGSCPVAGFGISGVEPSGSAVRQFLHEEYQLQTSSTPLILPLPYVTLLPSALRTYNTIYVTDYTLLQMSQRKLVTV
jgi:hypothetical protein